MDTDGHRSAGVTKRPEAVARAQRGPEETLSPPSLRGGVADQVLRDLSARRPTMTIQARKGWRLFDWRECTEYRDLLYFLVLRDVTVIYKQTVLGIAWAV